MNRSLPTFPSKQPIYVPSIPASIWTDGSPERAIETEPLPNFAMAPSLSEGFGLPRSKGNTKPDRLITDEEKIIAISMVRSTTIASSPTTQTDPPYTLFRFFPFMRGVLQVVGLAMFSFAAISPVHSQQPNAIQKIGKTIADSPSDYYRFEKWVVNGTEDSRRWRVTLAIPRQASAESGFASFWMLDGNASLMEFNETLLKELSQTSSPPVLVFLGYDNDLRIDTPARTLDYTPVPEGIDEENPADRKSGGASEFLDVLQSPIKTEVAKRVKLDAKKSTLWGHSFGGLFVLYALVEKPDSFHTFIAASPSMWWAKGFMIKRFEAFSSKQLNEQVQLTIHLGGSERNGDYGKRDLSNPQVVAHLKRIQSVPPDSAFRLFERLSAVENLDCRYQEFPDLGHGPMFRASLLTSLQDAFGIPPSITE